MVHTPDDAGALQRWLFFTTSRRHDEAPPVRRRRSKCASAEHLFQREPGLYLDTQALAMNQANGRPSGNNKVAASETRSPIPWCDRRRTYCASGCTLRDKLSNSGACDWEARMTALPPNAYIDDERQSRDSDRQPGSSEPNRQPRPNMDRQPRSQEQARQPGPRNQQVRERPPQGTGAGRATPAQRPGSGCRAGCGARCRCRACSGWRSSPRSRGAAGHVYGLAGNQGDRSACTGSSTCSRARTSARSDGDGSSRKPCFKGSGH